MAQNNAINNQTSQLTVDPAAATDSFIQFDESTTGKWRIGNDATDDSYRLSQGSALGTNDTFVMTSAGERTMPLQPAFFGYLPSTDNNVVGAGAFYGVGGTTALTEVFDQGSDFTTGGIFTAPVTGRYILTTSVLVQGVTTTTLYEQDIITSNRTWATRFVPASGAAQLSGPLTVLADMDAADTSNSRIQVSGEAGNTGDVFGAGSPWTHFAGCLEC